MKRVYGFPAYIESELKRIFAENNWTWAPRKLAEDILQLSDFYIQNPDSSTPWDKPWAQRALLVYYWPLNSIRFQAVYDELKKVNFLNGLEHFIDYGAGPATAAHVLKTDFKNIDLLEKSHVPQNWFKDFQWKKSSEPTSKTAAVFCYSMTELAELPKWAENCEALIILEPATQDDGRKLLTLRQNLIEKGFYAWAPCPHQGPCPLLLNSKTDWCHDRVELELPTWFQEIEQHLPIKNRTITMSYLAMRRLQPASPEWARITGDRLNEKGKTRQLVCRGNQREFLAWMHRDGEPPDFYRGERVLLQDFDNKSNELRIKKISRVE